MSVVNHDVSALHMRLFRNRHRDSTDFDELGGECFVSVHGFLFCFLLMVDVFSRTIECNVIVVVIFDDKNTTIHLDDSLQ